MKKILILFAHPAQEKSEVNVPLIEAAQKLDHVTVVDLYGEYPKFRINIEREQQRLIEHDVIVFKFPFYWYSTPAILKEWQDLVLEQVGVVRVVRPHQRVIMRGDLPSAVLVHRLGVEVVHRPVPAPLAADGL